MKKIRPELVFQVGMVVHSVDETLERLKECFAFDESSVAVKTTKDMAEAGTFTDCKYLEQPKDFYIKTARLNFGGIDFEYIEPLDPSGGDPFSDFLREHGQGIHHVNIKMDDRSGLELNLKELGVPELTSGKMGDKSFALYDLRELFGFIAEVGDMVVGPMADAYYGTHPRP